MNYRLRAYQLRRRNRPTLEQRSGGSPGAQLWGLLQWLITREERDIAGGAREEKNSCTSLKARQQSVLPGVYAGKTYGVLFTVQEVVAMRYWEIVAGPKKS